MEAKVKLRFSGVDWVSMRVRDRRRGNASRMDYVIIHSPIPHVHV